MSVAERFRPVCDTVTVKKTWIDKRLDELPGKNLAGLARAMDLPAARISEIKKGTRRVNLDERHPMATYLELSDEQLLKYLDANSAAGSHSQRSRSNTDSAPQDEPVSRASGQQGVAMNPQLRALKNRIKTLLSSLDTDTASMLVDQIIVERMEEDEAHASNPPRRA